MAATMSVPQSSGNGIGQSYADEPSSSTTPAMPTLALPSSSHPPYPAPDDVAYPEITIANPHVHNMARQPTFTNLPAGSLFRPARLPADMDIRLEKSSVWMGLDKATHKAVYFLPPMCRQCATTPGGMANCDRGYPTCQRCTLKGLVCESGTKWSQMKQKVKGGAGAGAAVVSALPAAPALTAENLARVAAEEEPDNRVRLSAAEKGKGRALPPSDKEDDKRRVFSLDPDHDHDMGMEIDGDISLEPQFPRLPSPVIGGRGKRTKKKRRLSLDEEIDPELLDDDGNLLPVKRKKSPPNPQPSTNHNPHLDANHAPHDIDPLSLPPLASDTISSSTASADDVAYFKRVERNNRKPPLKNMRAACPAWATTRRALQSGAEYFRDPTKIEGGSVEIGVGGVARGLILEGKSVGGGNYWGTKGAAGTVIISLGSARERRKSTDIPPKDAPTPRDRTEYSNAAGSSLPHINVLPSTIRIDKDGRSPLHPNGPFAEEPEIEALLMAQRARVPMAMAVAQDYLEPPFKVPRAFVVLGWFWLTDAWLEPEDLWEPGTSKSKRIQPEDIRKVRWKFRFEWCRGHQGVPWWSPNDDPARPPTPFVEYKFVIEPLAISGPGIKGASTVIHPSKKAVTDHRTACTLCGLVSETVYRDTKVCLNEECGGFFMPAGAGGGPGPVGLDPILKTPSLLRPVQRKVPEFLGLKLRGNDPHVTLEEGLDRSKLGSDFWQGWICGKCGMANERRRWSGWDCDGCKHHIAPPRKALLPERLQNPLHAGIKITGTPRKDIGYPSFPSSFKLTSGFTVYEHHIKIVKHLIEHPASGLQGQIYHALHTRRENVIDVASRVWKELQGDGEERKIVTGGLLKRLIMVESSKRPAERHHSPFYTMAVGPSAPFQISGIPHMSDALPWSHAPTACLDAMDLINFRAGCMFPGLTERFNSLIVAVTPPPVIHAPPLSVKLQAGEYLSILILGSEGKIFITPLSSSTDVSSKTMARSTSAAKSASVIMQHGDVFGVVADKGALEISIQMEGFGMVYFGQQVYNALCEPGIGAHTITSDNPPRSTDDPGPDSKGVLGDINLNTPAIPLPPPKPKTFTPAPLTNWYIGPRPLDPSQPLRLCRPTRTLPGAAAPQVDEEMAGNEETGGGGEAFPYGDIPGIEVDPSQASGYIIVDDGPAPSDLGNEGEVEHAVPGSPKVLECDIPPSPTIAPVGTTTKRRVTTSGTGKTAGTAMAAPGDDPLTTTPLPPRQKRKYVFKNKPAVGDQDEGAVEGADSPAVDGVPKPKPRPRASTGTNGRAKGRVSDMGVGHGPEGGLGVGVGEGSNSSPVGTPGSTDSPVHLKGRWAGRPIKNVGMARAARKSANELKKEGLAETAEKVKVKRKPKLKKVAVVDVELGPDEGEEEELEDIGFDDEDEMMGEEVENGDHGMIRE